MSTEYCAVNFVPVTNDGDQKALEYCGACMINPFYPISSRDTAHLAAKEIVFADSTGFQALLSFPTKRRVVLSTVARPEESTDEVLFLNPFHNCMESARTHTTTAFLIDYPTDKDDTDEVYNWKLRMSQQARDLTLPLAAKLCPETALAIALQPRHMGELESYFDDMAVPEVRTYGFPLRDSNVLDIAYVLSFLHEREVPKVHMLGSSAPHRIMVLAAAAGLGMFERITFDSNTWQAYFGGKRYFFDHETLRRRPRKKKLYPGARIKLALDQHGGDFDLFLSGLRPPNHATVKEWIGIYNIRVIQYFTDRLAGLARRGELADFVQGCWLPQKRKTEVLQAIEMLGLAVEQGHDAAADYYRRTKPPEARKTS